MKQKHVRINDKIKGATLTEGQKADLMAGKKVRIDGMTGKNDKKFSAVLQVNPGGRNIGFSDFKQEKAQNEKKDQAETKKTGKAMKVR